MRNGASNGHSGQDRVAERGYGLLVAATPPGRYPAIDATEALPALAATPPAVLLGTATGSVVQLADPGDPHTVLSHLRTAAAHDGPLLVYLAGQLMLDSRQKLPHLALTKSTPRSVRYTGLPWHWLAAEFAHRAPGLTTVVADLVSDDAMWQRGAHHHLGNGLALYGTLTPPPAKRRTAAPEYSRALAAILRGSTARPPLETLHQHVVQSGQLTGLTRVLLGGGLPVQRPSRHVSPPAPVPVAAVHTTSVPAASAPVEPVSAPSVPAAPAAPPVQAPTRPADPHGAVYQAVREGRHREAATIAAAWETAALREGGPHSPKAIHWVEVRADLAHQAGDASRACTLWLQAASVRLQSGQDPDAEDVFGAVDRAHHCWHQVGDPGQARQLGLQLAQLRERAPGRRPGALRDVRNRLTSLGDGR
ncbi:hypothetical protein ACFPA8_23855 [Streptomyces ovatisporus]|uniref:Uncharacterized protein n=1 Tax=Streptomyces ovatisporus TaxID=1128682 RepID=A0ABV9AB62_9ACTN